MLREPKAMLIFASALITLAVACKLLIPKDLPWRIPGGWPLGSHYYRPDTVAFRLLLGAAIFVGFLDVLGSLIWRQS